MQLTYGQICIRGDEEIQPLEEFAETRDGGALCLKCAYLWNFCEICGSIKLSLSQPSDEQLHFEEECFK